MHACMRACMHAGRSVGRWIDESIIDWSTGRGFVPDLLLHLDVRVDGHALRLGRALHLLDLGGKVGAWVYVGTR